MTVVRENRLHVFQICFCLAVILQPRWCFPLRQLGISFWLKHSSACSFKLWKGGRGGKKRNTLSWYLWWAGFYVQPYIEICQSNPWTLYYGSSLPGSECWASKKGARNAQWICDRARVASWTYDSEPQFPYVAWPEGLHFCWWAKSWDTGPILLKKGHQTPAHMLFTQVNISTDFAFLQGPKIPIPRAL